VQSRFMIIRMLRKGPCTVSYGGFSYRVEAVSDEGSDTSRIAARLLSSTGRLWEPPHEQELTLGFASKDGAELAWSERFETQEKFFLQRALVDRLIDDGNAVEIEQDAIEVARPAPQRSAVPATG
jgi:hypothetical protein